MTSESPLEACMKEGRGFLVNGSFLAFTHAPELLTRLTGLGMIKCATSPRKQLPGQRGQVLFQVETVGRFIRPA